MRVLLLLGVALLFVSAFADHHKVHQKDTKDDHDHKHDHDDHDHHDHKDSNHKKREQHDKKHHHHHNESMPCHKLAEYNSKFAFDLFRQVALDHPSENIVLSPVSISTTLAFLSLGAKAQTHSQIIEGMRFNTSEISQQEINEGFQHLMELMDDVDRELQLSSGNALFISKEHKILQTFLDEAKRLYHAEAFSTDFKNTEEAIKQINSYVEKNTKGKIAKLLDSVDQEAIFVLINYIYFKAKWEHPFDKEWTKEGDFYVNENTTVKASFMSRTGMYKVAFANDATVLSMPYKGNVNALFIMPNEGKFSEVERNLNKESIMRWKKSMSNRFMDITIPKFSIDGSVHLKETLNKMGMIDVFSNNADLSGITGEANIKVSKAVHKALLSVNEYGTEATGVTALEITPMMLPPRVKFDRSFIMCSYDQKTKSVPFIARITNPQK